MVIAFVYFIGMLSLNKMARQGTLPAEIAVWTPNLAFALLGLAMMSRLEAPGDRDYLGRLAAFFRRAGQRQQRGLGKLKQRSWTLRLPVLVQVIDTYVLAGFLFYFVLLLVSFVLMYHFFQFFTLLSDMIKNNIPMSHMLSYHFFLTPRLVYQFAPVAVLAAVLVVFGVMAKNNEVTAFKACGISVYRLAAPVLIGGLLLSCGLFAFDYYWLPTADRRQDQLYSEIKNKAPQTYLRADHKWVYGLHDRVYYYKYFLPAERAMTGVNVYEIDPVHFRLTKHISAEKARWEPSLNKWVFENGWSRGFKGDKVGAFDPFPGAARTFDELEEKPDYFMKEKTQPLQMNFYELQAEIADLKQSGFDFDTTVALQVQLQKKFSAPLFALILAIVSVPFAFKGGNRGAMAGVGISFLIFIAYWGLDQFFEQVGNLNQLSPAVAAWSPDVMFSLVGLYFMARLRT
jgi:LPS export ABC transporter permease LptG